MTTEKNEPINPKIGAFVLETLTTGMYTNPLDTLREYVQNSFDAIREAERNGILADGAGRIEIFIDEKARSITLRDNGIGILVNDVPSRLINIGMSSKNIQVNAGFRGIGRLAGIAYCKRLVFTTQADGESYISSVVFDCEKLRESMSPRMIQVKELREVINSHSETLKEKVGKKNHFFEVKMEEISEAGHAFLNLNELHDYLFQVAPVGMDTQSFHHSGKIYRWLKDHNISIPTISIIITSGASRYQVFKPYKQLTYTTAKEKFKIHIRDIRFFPEKAGPASPFWGWYAETNCPGMFGDEKVAGFRLRKSNIGIGMGDRMTEIFAEAAESYSRFNKYFMGEIYIQDPNVVPNARRDGFEDSPEWTAIRNSLIEFARERSREAYQLSQARNQDIEKLKSSVENEIAEANKKTKTGLASKEEKGKVLERIDKQIDKLESARKSDRSDKERDELDCFLKKLQTIRQVIDTKTDYTGQKLNSSLDNKQQRIIRTIIELLYNILDEESFEKARNAILSKYGLPDKEKKK